MSVENVFSLIKENEVKFVDLHFTDNKSKEQHIYIPAHQNEAKFLEDDKMFDGSSVDGWQGIKESDMGMMTAPSSLVLDP